MKFKLIYFTFFSFLLCFSPIMVRADWKQAILVIKDEKTKKTLK